MSARHFISALALLSNAATSVPLFAQDKSSQPDADLERDFANPPQAARPHVWWQWLNGNITPAGIDKDFDLMSRIGIGGVQNFDANLKTPQIVAQRLVYMQPAWKAAFKHAVELADAKGLEFTIASSPGWSEIGGPWVKPEEGMKKLVWSETLVAGGQRFSGPAPLPPQQTGPYQDLETAEPFASGVGAEPPQASGRIAILAVQVQAAQLPEPIVSAVTGSRCWATWSSDPTRNRTDSCSTCVPRWAN